jgi:hypothetical protein
MSIIGDISNWHSDSASVVALRSFEEGMVVVIWGFSG